MAWADMRDRMHQRVVSQLNDGLAEYRHGETVVPGIQVIVERNLMQNGADGVFRSKATGISWRTAHLPAASRGGVFVFDGASYVVEEIVTDDGHMITAACMVQP